MLETEERRRMVQQNMANLKRQRTIEAERVKMEREEELSRTVMSEEKRCV